LKKTIFIIGSIVVFASQIFALPLPPLGYGQTVTPGVYTVPASILTSNGVLSNEVNPLWAFGPKAAHSGGNVSEQVYVDPVSHDFDFFYQVSDCSTKSPISGCGKTAYKDNPITSFAVTDYSGVKITGVGYVPEPNHINIAANSPNSPFYADLPNFAGDFQTPNKDQVHFHNVAVNPDSVSRSTVGADGGATITWDFTNSPLHASDITAILVIKTNVPAQQGNMQQGTGMLFNAASTNLSTVVLESPVAPEPGFYGLLTLGITGMYFVATRRKRSAADVSEPNKEDRTIE